MMEDVFFWGVFFGTFLSETVKNLAKGSANILQEKVGEFLKPELNALNLSAEDSPKEIQRKLEEKVEIKEQIVQKIESHTELFKQLKEAINKLQVRKIKAENYFEHVNEVNIDQRRK